MRNSPKKKYKPSVFRSIHEESNHDESLFDKKSPMKSDDKDLEEKFAKEMEGLTTERPTDMQSQISQELKMMDQNENEYETNIDVVADSAANAFSD